MSAGVYSSLPELVALQAHALRNGRATGLSGRQPPTSQLAGRHASRLRGRGLLFEELRLYRPGDDVRRIDWRTSARRGEAHTRVYAEERERPVHLVVDQRLGMFFGSVAQMKSVTAVELAALIAWQALAAGDRVGATVVNDSACEHIAPHRQRATVLRLLGTLVAHNRALGLDRQITPDPARLGQALHEIAARATHDALVVIISDFQVTGGTSDDATRVAVRRLARHNDVIAILVHDPLSTRLRQLPPRLPASVLSDGRNHAQFDLNAAPIRHAFTALMAERDDFLDRLRRELDIPCLAIDTTGDVPRQLARMLGQG